MANRPFWSHWLHSWRLRWSNDLDPLWNRAQAWFDMVIIDHGYTRYLYPNATWVSQGRVYRQNHPPPAYVRRAKRIGIKTVVNLRGHNLIGSNQLSERACRKAGLKLVYFRALSRAAPTKETLHAAGQMFAELEYPALFHCKSGADRAGIVSALYLLMHEKRPIEEAQAQLHWRFGHFRSAATGVLDYFLESYRLAHQASGIDFMDWVDNHYDPKALQAAFKTKSVANFLVDRILNRE